VKVQLRATVRVPRWAGRLSDLPERVTTQALKDARGFLLSEAQKNVTVGGQDGLRVRTGKGRRSIRTYQDGLTLGLGASWYMRLHNNIPDGGLVIRPVRATWLRFQIPGVGWRRAKQVTLHRRPWADNALAATVKVFPKYFRLALERES
jgi:hypothetical protein